MRFGSLFSGIGGIDLALEAAGMEPAFQVEIDRDARRILAKYWPDVPRFTDICRVHAAGRCGGECEWCVPAVDVLAGGWPCQDLSVAGLRAGLAGERSGLWHEFARLIAELAPRWVLAENVPGLLSSWSPTEPPPDPLDMDSTEGPPTWEVDEISDSGTVLADLAERGYGWAFRIVDAQHFGVPQRRRRVFLVGCLGDGRSAAAVLLEPESLRGDSEAGGEAGTRVAGSLAPGAHPGGFNGRDIDAGTFAVSTLQGGGKRGHRIDAETAAGGARSVSALTHSHGGADDNDAQAGHLVVSPTLRSGAKGGRSHGKTNGTDRAALIVSHETGQGWWKESEVSGTLRAEGEGRPSRPSHVIAHSLRAEGFDASEDGTGRGTPPPVAPSLTAFNMDSRSPQNEEQQRAVTAVHAAISAVRRLTPLECERLQGLPDGWTSHDAEGKPLSDAARYRLVGNSVAVPCVEWIARRLIGVDAGRDPNALTAAMGSGGAGHNGKDEFVVESS